MEEDLEEVVEVETAAKEVEMEEIASEEVEAREAREEGSAVATEEVASAEEEMVQQCRCRSARRSPRDMYRRTQAEVVMEEEEDSEVEVDSEDSGVEPAEEECYQLAVERGEEDSVEEEAQEVGSAEALAEGLHMHDGSSEYTACTVSVHAYTYAHIRAKRKQRVTNQWNFFPFVSLAKSVQLWNRVVLTH